MLCPGEHCYLDYPMDKGDLPEVNWGMPVTSLKRVYELDPRWGLDDEFERDFSLVSLARCGANVCLSPSACTTKPSLVQWH